MTEERRDIYEVANQLGGYVGPDTDERLAAFLIREAGEAATLADEIVRLNDILSTFEYVIEAAGASEENIEYKRACNELQTELYSLWQTGVPVVNRLEWKPSENEWDKGDEVTVAKTPFGTYTVEEGFKDYDARLGVVWHAYYFYDEQEVDREFETKELAMEFLETIYRDRVLQSISWTSKRNAS